MDASDIARHRVCGIFSLPVRVGLPVHLALLLRPATDTKRVNRSACRASRRIWMEQATADRGPEALRACRRRAAPGDDVGRHGDPPHALRAGHEGPDRPRARLRQRRARLRGRHRPQELRAVPRRARLRRLAAGLPRQPGPRGQPHPVHGRRHRDARLAGRHRRGPPAHRRGLRPGHGPLRRRPVALHGDRRRPGRTALGDLLVAGRPPDRHARQPRARGRPPGDDVQEARDQGPEHRLRPRLPARPRGRARDARAALPPRLRQPGGPAHLLRLRRRLRLLEHQRGDDGRGRAEHLRHQQHHVLRAHLADDPQEPRGRSRRAGRLPRQRRSLPHADLVPHRRAQPDVRAARAAAQLRARARRPTGPSATPTMSSRTTRTWTCGSARTPSATSSRPPSPSWSARTREHHRRRTSTRHDRHAAPARCRTCSATR